MSFQRGEAQLNEKINRQARGRIRSRIGSFLRAVYDRGPGNPTARRAAGRGA